MFAWRRRDRRNPQRPADNRRDEPGLIGVLDDAHGLRAEGGGRRESREGSSEQAPRHRLAGSFLLVEQGVRRRLPCLGIGQGVLLELTGPSI